MISPNRSAAAWPQAYTDPPSPGPTDQTARPPTRTAERYPVSAADANRKGSCMRHRPLRTPPETKHPGATRGENRLPDEALRWATAGTSPAITHLADYRLRAAYLPAFFAVVLRVCFLAVFLAGLLRAVFLTAFFVAFLAGLLRAVFLVAFFVAFLAVVLRAVFLAVFFVAFLAVVLRAVFLAAFFVA